MHDSVFGDADLVDPAKNGEPEPGRREQRSMSQHSRTDSRREENWKLRASAARHAQSLEAFNYRLITALALTIFPVRTATCVHRERNAICIRDQTRLDSDFARLSDQLRKSLTAK